MHGKWEGTAGQLLKAGEQLGFGRIAPSAQKLGFELRRLEPQFAQYDNTEYHWKSKGNAGKLHCFQAINMSDTWIELEDVPLPF